MMAAQWIVIVVIAVALLWAVLTYNSLVRLKMRVQNAWKQIDVQLKRRYDLIPNLVEAVKGYMKHERETLEKVIEARNRAASTGNVRDKARAEGELTGLLGRLFALMENYPDLKANENVMELQEELTSTENRIAFARQFYNDMVMQYNTKQEVFPSSIIARMFNFKPADYFEAEEETKQAPRVDLKYS